MSGRIIKLLGQRASKDTAGSKKVRKLIDKAREIGEKVGGNDGNEITETLSRMVRIQEEEKKPLTDKTLSNITKLLGDMKKELTPTEKSMKTYEGSPEYVQDRGKPRREQEIQTKRWPKPARGIVDLHAIDNALHIFNNADARPDVPSKWDKLAADSLKNMSYSAPRNAFEELIQLTNEGKLWKFPINNEQGLEKEAEVPFYKHVILDEHLKDFPKVGPVREFMELVLIGLSDNCYITVERKLAYIEWFKNYFAQKEDLLRAANAI